MQYRAELLAERERARAEMAEAERQMGEEHALKMQQFREAVLAKLDVHADPYKPTAASQAEHVVQSLGEKREKLFPLHGYADATLMKDVRFKIGHALRNAGLNGTEYARKLLNDPTRWGGPSRPDAVVSNFTFGPDP